MTAITTGAPTMKNVVEVSELEDEGKHDRELTNKEADFGSDHDKDAGKTLFWISPKSLYGTERFFFTPFSWAQFCSRVLIYPHKALNTEVISSRLIKMICDERQNRVKERQLTLKLKRDRQHRETEGKEGRIIFRGCVPPSSPQYGTTQVLKLLSRIGEGYDFEIRGRPAFPDHFFYARFVMGETFDVGTGDEPQPMHLGVYLAHSEVGAVSSGMRLDALLFDETERNAIVIRRSGKPLFLLKNEHKEAPLFEEEVAEAIGSVANSAEAIVETAQSSREKVYDRYYDVLVSICRRYGVEGKVGKKILEQFEERVSSGTRPTKAAIIATICNVAKEERPDRRFDLEVVAGRILIDSEV